MDEKELTPRERAQITRMRNTEARTKKYQEETAAIRSARLALQRIVDDPSSTVEQILQSTKLMVDIGKRY